MFKFFRKIFLILLLGSLFFVLIKFKGDNEITNKKNINEDGYELVKSSKNIVEKWFKNNSNENSSRNIASDIEVDSYNLKSLTNENRQKKKQSAQFFEGTEDAIITLINKERFDRGMDSLDRSKRLMKSAKAKAEDMKKNQYFEHVSKEKIQPWFFAERINYHYEKFGENIARDYLSANSVHKAFMDSVGHRKNILDNDFKDVGVAVFQIEIEEGLKYIVVEHFGKQLKNINPEEKNKYSDKSKRLCRIQKNKKEELKKMIKKQKKNIKKFEKEINKQAIEEGLERLKELEKIKDKTNNYLSDCKILKEKFKK